MKIAEIHVFSFALSALNQQKLPFKVAYAVARNERTVKPILEAFEAARIALARNHSELDDKGEPLVENNQYVLKDRVAFEAELNTLSTQVEEVTLHEVSIDDLESLSIEPAIVSALMPMIKSS